jgi:hypothetical protein
MDKEITRMFVSSLMFALVLSAVCLWPDWSVKGGSTITVPDDYSTIQGAINNAVNGDTILVKAGIYHEHVVVLMATTQDT